MPAPAEVLALSGSIRRHADAVAAALDSRTADTRAWPTELHPAFVIRLLQRAQEYEHAAALRQELDAALAVKDQSIEQAIASEGRHQALAQASMAGLIGSLRLISSFDWSELFESVNIVEQVLQRDPAGVYGRMDFRSRDRYRHAVEELAAPTGEAQLRVALKAVEYARRTGETSPGARGAGTAALVTVAVAYAHAYGWRDLSLLAVALLAAVPASEFTIQLVQRA